MCSYITATGDIAGSAKGQKGWFRVNQARCYFDHPYHAPYGHTLNIDFVNEAGGPSARCAVELTAESARQLIQLIETALEAAGDQAA